MSSLTDTPISCFENGEEFTQNDLPLVHICVRGGRGYQLVNHKLVRHIGLCQEQGLSDEAGQPQGTCTATPPNLHLITHQQTRVLPSTQAQPESGPTVQLQDAAIKLSFLRSLFALCRVCDTVAA